ncbi:MAG TPA: dienelactone hydrolase family protein [Gaiellaceae bacterium]|nr:dienelactone hydrolase family protein [Gaiellaceae bacterium]
MCFDVDSEPPVPRIAGAAVSHDDLTLTGADGNAFAAFRAAPEPPGATGIVILPDVRGLYRFYEELALRFAERGQAAIAIDYFGRTAGAAKRRDDFDYRPHVEQTTPEGIQSDVAAAVAALRERGATSIFTVGFCFGGRNSWLAAASGHGLCGAVGFYGHPGSVIERIPEMTAPILALQAGDDARITPFINKVFDAALEIGGVEHELVVYDGAPHSFFDRKQEEFRDAGDDAWRRTLEFVARHA